MDDLTLLILIIALPLLAELYIKITYSKYLKKYSSKDLNGLDVARNILDRNGLNEVMVIETRGNLTDNYNPSRKVVKLSTNIFHDSTVASVAVAAHECGHALQDKEGYFFLRFRSAIVPIVNIVSRFSYIFIVLGFILEIMNLVYIGIAAVAVGVFFQLITLPVEFNASKRAEKELVNLGLVNDSDLSGVKEMLRAAALTYVASTLAGILQLVRLLGIARDR